MTANFLWGAVGTVMHLLTTELDSKTNGTYTSLGPATSNSGNYQMGKLYLHVASAAFVNPSYLQTFCVGSTDTTNTTYPAIDASNSSNYAWPTIYIQGTTAAHDETYEYVTIPLGYFKAGGVTGGSCPTLATGNTLDLYPTPTQY